MEDFRCKVNLGCGISGAKGWHNFDNSPTIWLSRVPLLRRWKRLPRWPSDVRHLDVIKGLPFKPGTVDCIYSSHMIEHLAFIDAVKVLSHCRKVLRVGGVLRITVPDLRIMVDDYVANGDAARLVERLHLSSNFSDVFHKGACHRAMYDADYLAFLFNKAGFASPERRQFGESHIPEIGEVELESRRFGGLFMEATKHSPQEAPAGRT
jgi:SAM-dependent methyltransferase